MRNKDCTYSVAERLTKKKSRSHAVSAAHETANTTPPAPPRMVMTVEEMGKELGLSRATAYELVQRPDFPSFSIGRRVLVSRDGLLKWIEKQYTSKNPDHSQTIDA